MNLRFSAQPLQGGSLLAKRRMSCINAPELRLASKRFALRIASTDSLAHSNPIRRISVALIVSQVTNGLPSYKAVELPPAATSKLQPRSDLRDSLRQGREGWPNPSLTFDKVSMNQFPTSVDDPLTSHHTSTFGLDPERLIL